MQAALLRDSAPLVRNLHEAWLRAASEQGATRTVLAALRLRQAGLRRQAEAPPPEREAEAPPAELARQ